MNMHFETARATMVMPTFNSLWCICDSRVQEKPTDSTHTHIYISNTTTEVLPNNM